MNTGLDQINVNQIRGRLDLIISVFIRRILDYAIFIFSRGTLIISTFPRIILDLIISEKKTEPAHIHIS